MKKTSFIIQLFAAFILLLFGSANAFAGTLVIDVPDEPEPTTETVIYQCDMGTRKENFEATYHNAGSIALVDLKWEGKRIIGSRVISASGAKYAGGPYVWWTKRNEAIFSDLLNDPKEKHLIICVEQQETE